MLLTMLQITERDGLRCAGLIMFSGAVAGAGLVELLSGPLEQPSDLSIQVLSLTMLRFLGPLLVAMIAITRLTPSWLVRGREPGRRAWLNAVVPAALVGPILELDMLLGASISGMLLTPRADLHGELADLLASITPLELTGALMRSSLYLGAAAALAVRLARHPLRTANGPEEQVSGTLLREFVLVLGIKLFWILGANLQ